MKSLSVLHWMFIELPRGILKILQLIFELIFEVFIVMVWQFKPWVVITFLVPILMVVFSCWGPLPGGPALVIYLALLAVIGLVRLFIPIYYLLKEWNSENGTPYEKYKGKKFCIDATHGLILGAIPAIVMMAIHFWNISQ